MEKLERTISGDSSRSRHALSSAASPAVCRKARSDLDVASGNVERSSVSMPPPSTVHTARHPVSRRPSKASDSLLAVVDMSQRTSPGSVIDDEGLVNEGSSTALKVVDSSNSMLPEAALRPPRASDGEYDANRMSFSSLYSLGSAIYNSARGLASGAPSGPSSAAESEVDGKQIKDIDQTLSGELTCKQPVPKVLRMAQRLLLRLYILLQQARAYTLVQQRKP